LDENKNFTLIIVSDHGMGRDDYRGGPILIRNYESYGAKKHIVFLINVLLERLNLLTFDNPYGKKDEEALTIDFTKTKAYFCNNLKVL
jgi:hypothetical protein